MVRFFHVSAGFTFFFCIFAAELTTMNKKFSFRDVPDGYHLCFNTECEKHADCIRYLAGKHLPTIVMGGPCVYPNAWKGGSCPYFKQTRIIHGAWGLRNLFKGIAQKDAQILKAKVTNYLGGPVAAYKYQHGEILLTPEQQAHIKELFEELGYQNELVFDGFTFIYDFTD